MPSFELPYNYYHLVVGSYLSNVECLGESKNKFSSSCDTFEGGQYGAGKTRASRGAQRGMFKPESRVKGN